MQTNRQELVQFSETGGRGEETTGRIVASALGFGMAYYFDVGDGGERRQRLHHLARRAARDLSARWRPMSGSARGVRPVLRGHARRGSSPRRPPWELCADFRCTGDHPFSRVRPLFPRLRPRLGLTRALDGGPAGNVSRMWPNDRGAGSPWTALARTRLHVTEPPRARGRDGAGALRNPVRVSSPAPAPASSRGQLVVGAGRHHGDHHRQRDRRHALAAAPEHAADEHDDHRWRHGRAHRDAQVPRDACWCHGHLTGWDPGWYDGFPLYTFYFTIPDLFIAIGGWIIPYGVAFKLGTILGSVILPDLRLGLRPFLPAPPAAPDDPGRRHSALPVRLHVHDLRREPLLDAGRGVRLLLQPVAGRAVSRPLRLCCQGGQIPRLGGDRARRVRPVAHRRRACTPSGGAAILTVVELLPARWGIADSALHIWRGDDTAVQVPRTRILWWAGSTVGNRTAAFRMVAGPLRAGARLLVVDGVHERGGLGPVLPRS